MSQVVLPVHRRVSSAHLQAVRDNPTRRAYLLLWLGFIAAPIIAGADKFFHLLVDWDLYLAPLVNRLLGHGHQFMLAVGVVEIAAGIGVALRPRIFSYVVAAWLFGIIVNLLFFPPSLAHYDVALRDFGLFLGALALGQLSGRCASAD